MDISEYLPMFLAEGREHLQELNLAVVRIEERPDDQETVDEIFRIAHSLKGMSATMGFAGMAALTHEMEDVFELLRQRKGGLPREAIDVLLECLDALSAAVDAIDESGEEEIEPDAADHAPQGPRSASATPREPEVKRDRRGARRSRRDGRRPPRRPGQRDAVRRRAAPVRARLHGALRARRARRDARLHPDARTTSTPSPAREIDAWMVSERADSELAAVVGAVSDVAHVEVFEAVSDAAVETGEEIIDEAPKPEAAAAASPSPAVASEGLLDRPRRRRAARPADALHGRARPAPHRRSRRSPPTPTCRASRRRCRTSPAPRTPSRRWSCRSG